MKITFVRCVRNTDYIKDHDGTVHDADDLTVGMHYEVVEEEDGCYRVRDDSGEDYLYPASFFEKVPV